MVNMNLQRAVQSILEGGCIVYPTETLYALGADAFNPRATERINKIKSRPTEKPLPIIIGDWNQLSLVTTWQSEELFYLGQLFWPGPLSILVPGKTTLSNDVMDQKGWCSLRWTSHPLAQRLCLETRHPLVATSANLSGKKEASLSSELDQKVLSQIDQLITDGPEPKGGPPSTLIRICSPNTLQLIRPGVISKSELNKAGFEFID